MADPSRDPGTEQPHVEAARDAACFGVAGVVEHRSVCLDPRWQWGEAGNIWYNSAVRSALYLAGHWTRRGAGALRSALSAPRRRP